MASQTPRPTAVRIVQNLLSQHYQLSSGDIYRLGTEGLKPVLPPAHVLTADGRIRMKKVSNMREGRRMWVPPPAPPLPHHPFQSVRHLKTKILDSLEIQNLIHKSKYQRPIQTKQEQKEAEDQARRITRRAERKAMAAGLPTPPPVLPRTTVEVYGWKMGPRPTSGEDETAPWDSQAVNSGEVSDMPAHSGALKGLPWPTDAGDNTSSSISTENSTDQNGSSSNSTKPSPVYQDIATLAAWDRAERLELQYIQAKEHEMEQIAIRKAQRREAYKILNAKMKLERAEDVRTGRAEQLKREKARLDAIEEIAKYAKQTGEDVSGWFEELGSVPQEQWDDFRKPQVRNAYDESSDHSEQERSFGNLNSGSDGRNSMRESFFPTRSERRHVNHQSQTPWALGRLQSKNARGGYRKSFTVNNTSRDDFGTGERRSSPFLRRSRESEGDAGGDRKSYGIRSESEGEGDYGGSRYNDRWSGREGVSNRTWSSREGDNDKSWSGRTDRDDYGKRRNENTWSSRENTGMGMRMSQVGLRSGSKGGGGFGLSKSSPSL